MPSVPVTFHAARALIASAWLYVLGEPGTPSGAQSSKLCPRPLWWGGMHELEQHEEPEHSQPSPDEPLQSIWPEPQLTLVQTPFWQLLLAQSEPVRHSTHVPLALQSLPPLSLQALPCAFGGFDGTPELQASLVHCLPSTGRSVSSATVVEPPIPSQTAFLQSPAVCDASGVPCGAVVMLHAPALQIAVAHTVPVGGQSLAARQATHAPAPLQTLPPPSVQIVPDVLGGFEGVPAAQRSIVHCLPSTGRSVPSATATICPTPSHWLRLQSPVVCALVILPEAAKLMPQTPFTHVRIAHSVS